MTERQWIERVPNPDPMSAQLARQAADALLARGPVVAGDRRVHAIARQFGIVPELILDELEARIRAAAAR